MSVLLYSGNLYTLDEVDELYKVRWTLTQKNTWVDGWPKKTESTHSWVQRNIGRNKQIPYKHNQVFLLMVHHGDEHVVGDASTCDVYLRSW